MMKPLSDSHGSYFAGSLLIPTLPEGRKSEYNGSNIDYLSLQYKTLSPLINKFRSQGIEDELIESVLHEVDNELLFRTHPDAVNKLFGRDKETLSIIEHNQDVYKRAMYSKALGGALSDEEIEERVAAAKTLNVPETLFLKYDELYQDKKIKHALKLREGYWERVRNDAESELLNAELSLMNWDAVEKGRELTEAEEKRLDWIEKRMAELEPAVTNSLFQNMVGGLAGYGMQQLGSASRSVPYMAGGALMGLAALASGPQAAISLVPGSAVSAATAGAFAGWQAGRIYDMAKLEGGGAYREYMKMTDENGSHMDRQTARFAAFGVGILNAFIEEAQFQTVLKGLGIGFSSRAGAGNAKNALKEIFKIPSVSQAIADGVKVYGLNVSSEVGEEIAQRLVTIVGGEIGKLISGPEFGHISWEEITEELVNEGKGAFTQLALAVAPGGIRAAYSGLRERGGARRNNAHLKNEPGLSDANVTAREEAEAAQAPADDAEFVWLPRAAVESYMQSDTAPPDAARFKAIYDKAAENLGRTDHITMKALRESAAEAGVTDKAAFDALVAKARDAGLIDLGADFVTGEHADSVYRESKPGAENDGDSYRFGSVTWRDDAPATGPAGSVRLKTGETISLTTRRVERAAAETAPENKDGRPENKDGRPGAVAPTIALARGTENEVMFTASEFEELSRSAPEFVKSVMGDVRRGAREMTTNEGLRALEAKAAEDKRTREIRAFARETEDKAILAKMSKSEAKAFSRFASAIGAQLSRMTGKPIGEVMNFEMARERYEKWRARQGERGEALEQAMYPNPAKTIVEFRQNVLSGKSGKSTFSFRNKEGVNIEIASDDIIHTHKDHNLTDEQWQAAIDGIDDIEAAYFIEGEKGQYGGQPVAIKINTTLGKAGVVLIMTGNGRIFIKSAFFSTDNNLDNNWLKKPKRVNGEKRTPHAVKTDTSSTAPITGRPLSVKSIQEALGIVNRGGEVYEQYVGQNAQTADRLRLSDAERMAEEGADNDTIRQKTGWFKGMDGKWRFEIADFIGRIELPGTDSATLGSFYDNQILFDAYPELENMRVEFKDLGENAGYFDSDTSVITINSALSPDAQKRTILHETQHAIQDIEGFAAGSDLEGEQYERSAGEIEAEDTARRGELKLTGKQRKALSPNLREDAIVVFGGKEMGYRKKSSQWIGTTGLQLPNRTTIENLAQSVPTEADLVNASAPNANTRLMDDMSSIITLFETANVSSPYHEIMHHTLNVFDSLVDTEGVDERFRADFETILKENGVTKEEFRTDAEARRKAHEGFARGFEAYLATGEAPSKGLRAAFARVRQWLIDLYGDIEKTLGIELSPEMRGVYDRLLATPEEMTAEAEARTTMARLNEEVRAVSEELERLEVERQRKKSLSSGGTVSQTPAPARAPLSSNNPVNPEGATGLRYGKSDSNRTLPPPNENVNSNEADSEINTEGRPERGGPAVSERDAEDEFKKVRRENERVRREAKERERAENRAQEKEALNKKLKDKQKALRDEKREILKTVKKIVRMAKDTKVIWDAQQEIQELLSGYDLKRRSESVAIKKGRRILDGDGRSTTSARTANTTTEAAEVLEKADIIGRELENKTLGIKGVVSKSSLGKMQSDKAVKKSAHPAVHSFAIANIDKLFESAAFDVTHEDRKNDPNVKRIHRLGTLIQFDGDYYAVKITLKELLTSEQDKIYTVEAVTLEDIEKSAGRLDAADDSNAGRQSPIADFNKNILELYKKVKKNRRAARKDMSAYNIMSELEAYIEQNPEAEADINQKDARMLGKTALNDLTIGDIKRIADDVTEIYERGQREYAAWDASKRERSDEMGSAMFGKLLETEANTAPIVRNRDDTGKQYKGVLGRLERAKDWGASVLLDPQRFFDWLDGGKGSFKGPFVRFIADKWNANYSKQQRQVFRRRDAMQAKLNELGLNVRDLARAAATVGGVEFTYDQIMNVYAGLMNEKSRAAILYGNFKNLWDDTGDPMAVAQNLITHLSDDMKKAALLVIAEQEENFDRINGALIKATNRGMNKEENYSVSMRRTEHMGEGGNIIDDALADMLEEAKDTAGVMSRINDGFTISRIKIKDENQAPISLGLFANWNADVARQEHMAAFAEFAGDTARALMWKNQARPRETIGKMIRERFGSRAWKTLINNVNVMIKDDVTIADDFLNEVTSALSRNTAVVSIAYNAGTILKQTLSFPHFLPFAGPRHLFNAVVDFFTDHRNFMESAFNADSQLRAREGDIMLQRLQGNQSRIIQAGFAMVSRMDRWVATIGWQATYAANIARGLSYEAAVREAQRAVHLTQNATNVKDTPVAWRASGTIRLVMQFTGDTARMFGVTAYDLVQGVLSKEDNHIQKTMLRITALALIAMMSKALDRGLWRGNDDDEDDPEGFPAWFADALGRQAVKSIPIVGSEAVMFYDRLTGAAKYGTQYSAAMRPFAKAAEGVGLAFKGLGLEWEDGDASRMIFDFLDAAALTGAVSLPTTAIRRLVRGGVLLNEGRPLDASLQMIGRRVKDAE
ncbi:hypothetical protein FACS1894187_04970 [Synergistales bacterium]|nr:hypothetical protein FACS1894187_04970 [Synergistales bacterium]